MSGTINEVKKSQNPNLNFSCNICMCVLAAVVLKQEVICFSCTVLSLLCKHHPIAKEAFERGNNPIIIDNTNMQGWEMKPYVVQVSQLASSLISTVTEIIHSFCCCANCSGEGFHKTPLK